MANNMTVAQMHALLSGYLPTNNAEYMQAGHDVSQAGHPLQQILGLLGIGGAPLNQTSGILGDATLDATGSPAAATAAYMLPQIAGLPTGALKSVVGDLGKAGLGLVHDGMSFGQGPLSALQHLAPGVMKREGGNWFPGAVDQQINQMHALTDNPDIQGWLRGPMKNYLQKRFASPNDEIRKLYDQGINVSPEINLNGADATMSDAMGQILRQYADPSLNITQMGTSPMGRSWENRTDSIMGPDSRLHAIVKKYNSDGMPQYANNLTPKQRVGMLTTKYLQKSKNPNVASDLEIPTDLQGLLGRDLKNNFPEEYDQLVDHVNTDPNFINANFDKMGQNAPKTIMTSMRNSLNNMYTHLNNTPDARYTGTKFPMYLQAYVDPFKSPETLQKTRNMVGDNASWLDKVPLDEPINSFNKYQLNPGNPRTNILTDNQHNLPEFGHMVDIMQQNLDNGTLTPLQLASGRYSVEAAARDAHTANQAGLAEAAKQKQIAAAGLPVIEQYNSGHKWLELNNPNDINATRQALADEGDAMGHCVGGENYVRGVTNGTKRIMSLRDPNGNPRATIELVKTPADIPGHPDGWSVNQVKGPANRKPAPQDIPMVQDFIKHYGPWSGDIGDIQNTDLQRLDSAADFNSNSNPNYITGDDDKFTDKLNDFSNWARNTAEDQGHPFMDKNELLGHYTRITGDDGPVY